MATEITEKGLDMMASYVAAVREVVGMDIPISADHFGPLSVNSCIRLGKALTKYNLSWLEDMIPWQETELLKKISDAVDIPILTGEDIYLKESFEVLCRNHAVDIIHPDPLTSGGILETKNRRHGAVVRRSHGGALRAHAHRRAGLRARVSATENFLVLENHAVDVPYRSDLVDGIEKPIVNKGFITVPDKPGLGITSTKPPANSTWPSPDGSSPPTSGTAPAAPTIASGANMGSCSIRMPTVTKSPASCPWMETVNG